MRFKVFSCLWSFMWSNPFFAPVLPEGKIPQVLVSQRLPPFRLWKSWIRRLCSQITCATNCATPGYSVFAIIPWRRGEIKVFSVCSQLCGQSGFSGRFADPLQFRKRPCSKDFRTSATPIMDSNRRTPKCRVLPTALHPDILLSRL